MDGWHRVATLDELADKGRLVVKPAGRQIALFLHGARVLACNNRCPHEGYPLSQGTVDDACGPDGCHGTPRVCPGHCVGAGCDPMSSVEVPVTMSGWMPLSTRSQRATPTLNAPSEPPPPSTIAVVIVSVLPWNPRGARTRLSRTRR